MMNMQSRNQYLVELRTEYSKTKLKKKRGELQCSALVAEKLKQMGSATIDRKLKRAKQIELAKKKYKKKHPLLYQSIPVKVFAEQDRTILGNMQIDKKLDMLCRFYKQKNNSQKVDEKKKILPRFSGVGKIPVSV